MINKKREFIEGLPCIGLYVPSMEGLTVRQAVEDGFLVQVPWSHANKRAWIKHHYFKKKKELWDTGERYFWINDAFNKFADDLEETAKSIDFPDHEMPEGWLETFENS